MGSLSFPITDATDLDRLNEDDLFEGYRDGLHNAPQPGPGGNRSISYVHGWWTGATDGGHVEKPDWLASLVRDARKRGVGPFAVRAKT